MNYRAWVAILLALAILAFFIGLPIMRIVLPQELAMPEKLMQMYENILMVIIGALASWLGCEK